MKYRYTAKDSRGLSVKGLVEADSAHEVAGVLANQQLTPIAIHDVKPWLDTETLGLHFSRVAPVEVVNFTRQLATMITAGLPLTESLALLKTQSAPAMAKVLSDIASDVQGGAALSVAMAKHKTVFSKVYVALVRAGESAGVLETILDRLAINMDKRRDFEAKVKGAMIYPLIVMGGMGLLGVVMMTTVVPKLASLYKDLGSNLPWATQVVVFLSDTLVNYWWVILGFVIGLVMVVRGYLLTTEGRLWWDRTVFSIPIFGVLIKQIALSEFARTTALLIGAGISIVEAINTISEGLGNLAVEMELRRIAKQIERGFPVSVTFGESELFPPMMSSVTAVGEQTGKMDDVLGKLAAFYEAESENQVKTLTTALEPIILVIMAVGVGFMMYAIIMPFYGITDRIG